MLWLPIVVALIAAFASGGKLAGLRRLPLGGLTLIVAGFVLQLLAIRQAASASWLMYHGLLVGGALVNLAGFGFLWNLPFGKAMFLGVALNLVAMLANGGAMVITPENAAGAGFPTVSVAGEQRLTVGKSVAKPWDQTNLPWLTDFIHLKLPSYEKFFSVGDVILALAAGGMLFALLKEQEPSVPPPAPERVPVSF
ncbi:MAG: DUF5317 family protein [Chloroflexi bacterium]|nr:DUF5317 family protein [Chloroflexota bacterium]